MIVNGLGGLMMVIRLLAAFAVGGLVDLIWPKADSGVAVGGLMFFLLTPTSDLIYRWRTERERGLVRFIHPFTGGMFFFIPIWICFGLGPIAAGPVMMIVDPPKKTSPRRAALDPSAFTRDTSSPSAAR
ncbi:hypothetical protein [Gemmata sp.]|uniref:hypothetical protein n=1 Tax=Gemmata sp. TaxID=1914242 RepID=UPI003F6E4967